MSAFSIPVTRSSGRALVVANTSSRSRLVESLARQGYESIEADDPYGAVRELMRRPIGVDSVILSLACVFREELTVITSLRKRFPQLEIWLAHTDGRQASLAEAIRLGAAGLVDDEGLHRMVPASQPVSEPVYEALRPSDETSVEPRAHAMTSDSDLESGSGEPVLTADELRALLHDQPTFPGSRAGRDAS